MAQLTGNAFTAQNYQTEAADDTYSEASIFLRVPAGYSVDTDKLATIVRDATQQAFTTAVTKNDTTGTDTPVVTGTQADGTVTGTGNPTPVGVASPPTHTEAVTQPVTTPTT